MTITQRDPAPKELTMTCAAILEDAGIEPWPSQQLEPRALQWLMPPELIEDWLDPEVTPQMFGYPVHMEALLGENTVALVETIDIREVPAPSSMTGEK